jgi:hypothetical protein
MEQHIDNFTNSVFIAAITIIGSLVLITFITHSILKNSASPKTRQFIASMLWLFLMGYLGKNGYFMAIINNY